MARPPPQGPGAKPLVPPLIGDEIFEVISSGGLRQIVTLQQIAEFIGGGGGVIATVPNGGTGLGSLTLNGILYGNGVAPVGVTAAATEGNILVAGPGGVPEWTTSAGSVDEVLTSNGPGQIPTFQPAAGSTYPPLPVPNMQDFFQAAATAGLSANWIWGDYVAPAPIVITFLTGTNDVYFNFNGAQVSPGFTDPTSNLFEVTVPGTVSDVAASGFTMMNVTFFCVNEGTGGGACLNGLAYNVSLNANAIFGGQLFAVHAVAAARSGIQFLGSCFEIDVYGSNCRDNAVAGIECRNPTQGGGAGVISSINIWGGDLRTNGRGLLLSAVTTFQEPAGIHVFGTNFIANNNWGIDALSGIDQVIGCHLENNCEAAVSGQNAAITASFGTFVNCDSTFSSFFNPQVYCLNLNSGGAGSIIQQCGSFDESLGVPSLIGDLLGAGVIYGDLLMSVASFTSDGSWVLNLPTITVHPL